VVEQPQIGVCEDHVVLVRSLDALRIHNTARRSSNVPHATPTRPVDIVREGEERIARAHDAIELLAVLQLLLFRERCRYTVEVRLPLLTLATLEMFPGHEEIDGVCLVRTLGALLEGKIEHSLLMTEPPCVRLGTRKPRAVNARLLAGADTDDGAVVCVRYGVRLCVLEGQSGDDQIGHRRFRQLKCFQVRLCVWEVDATTHVLVRGDDVLEQTRVHLCVVSLLLHVDTINLSGLGRGRNIAWIDLGGC
jgi:hypothetical protein